MNTINKDRAIATRDGREAKIAHVNENIDLMVVLIKHEDGYWKGYNFPKDGQCGNPDLQLIEAVKENGIPVDLPDPFEMEGYSWEVVPLGEKFKAGSRYNCMNIKSKEWSYQTAANNLHGAVNSNDGFIYIQYTPITEEMTIDQAVSEALGRSIKIIK